MCRWVAITTLLIVSTAHAVQDNTDKAACYAGAYRLSDGTEIVLTSAQGNLRYRLLDGRTGRLAPDSATQFHSVPGWSEREPPVVRAMFAGCSNPAMSFQWGTAPPLSGARVTQPVIPIRFSNAGADLYGELHLPAQHRPRAVVVLQFGGGRDSAVATNYVQYLLPLRDIAVVIFDKRGTGKSTGNFTIDFTTLADDVVAAVHRVRSMPEVANVPLGLMGESQGGWVVPLAATKTSVDFVIVSYGLAVSLREENRLETLQGLQARGYSAAEQARALEVVAATDRIMISRFKEDGLDELRRLRQRYGSEKWYRDLSAPTLTGDYTSALANASDEEIAAVKAFFDIPYDLEYDPAPTLRQVTVPMLWILAGKDTEAPSASTDVILRDLQQHAAPIDIAVFPDADHGMIEVEQIAGSQKELDRHSPGYFDLLIDWSTRRTLGNATFGTAVLTPRQKP
ncbi:MAG TPA: alpha/beta hydrolase [Povalibacter sp.]